jgi:ABC-type uncharacterized transport system permease subunit
MNIILSLLEQGLTYIPHAIGMNIALLMLRIPFLALETAYVMGAIVASVIPDYVLTLPLIFILISLFLIGFGLTSLTMCLKYYLNMSYLLISILLWGISYGLNQWIIKGSHISLGSKTML